MKKDWKYQKKTAILVSETQRLAGDQYITELKYEKAKMSVVIHYQKWLDCTLYIYSSRYVWSLKCLWQIGVLSNARIFFMYF